MVLYAIHNQTIDTGGYMRYVQVSSKIYRDNTGRSIDFPTLLVEAK